MQVKGYRCSISCDKDTERWNKLFSNASKCVLTIVYPI